MSDNIFADALACADADKQAEFFNDFYRTLKTVCKNRHETQICYIADRLDENGREFCKSLHEASNIAVESRAKVESEISELYRQRRELESGLEALRKQREEQLP